MILLCMLITYCIRSLFLLYRHLAEEAEMTATVAATVVVAAAAVVTATVPICRSRCTGGVDIKLFIFYDN